jgi:hypothetical protein
LQSQPHSTSPPAGSIIYEYKSADGKPAIRVVRTPNKEFYQQHLDSSGNWINGTGAAKPPLYRLPELLAADPRKTVLLLDVA